MNHVLVELNARACLHLPISRPLLKVLHRYRAQLTDQVVDPLQFALGLRIELSLTHRRTREILRRMHAQLKGTILEALLLQPIAHGSAVELEMLIIVGEDDLSDFPIYSFLMLFKIVVCIRPRLLVHGYSHSTIELLLLIGGLLMKLIGTH